MAVTVEEKPGSRTLNIGDSSSVELQYVIRGTASDEEALNALIEAAPETYLDVLVPKSATVDPVCIDEDAPDACLWDGAVRYAPRHYVKPEPPQTGDSSFSFDTGGGTQHVTQSISTVQKYAPPGKTAPDFKGAVGVTHEAVEGVDITVPVYSFSETHYLPNATVTPAYKGKLFSLTGKTNNAAFKGCAAGECLFLGASGSKRSAQDDWEITFRFAASPNRTGIMGIAKKGWEYLWVRYADADDADAKAIVKRPVAAYVEKVYEEGSFADLGIGT